ncbi:YceI family protein [Mucilaginibacter sp.]|uniref:YceI family protein n=1 Tax=Mucilaginibacter sp. TaxID=1882438 RepID=UPI00284BF10B|nr:YceI family protein [Mucilaginibacter sp.]MDR3694798.1 YceI family protein [Mucilaginibacter sp.]
MLFKNLTCSFLLLITLTSFISPGYPNASSQIKKWVISENSNLRVNGSTNINTFICEIPSYDQIDTITVNKSNKDVLLSGTINLNVKSFDCHNVIMTHDLRKTLKQDQYPVLHISFLTLNKLPDLTAKAEPVTGWVFIEIAGVRKRFEVNYQISQDNQKIIHLLGSRDVNFSDFNLIPPRKLGGMIKTNDKLSVDFHLKMKSMD